MVPRPQTTYPDTRSKMQDPPAHNLGLTVAPKQESCILCLAFCF